MRKNRLVAISLIALGIAVVFYGYGPRIGDDPSKEAADVTVKNAESRLSEAEHAGEEVSELVHQLAVRFLEEYGETIDNPATRAKLFEERRRLIRQHGESHGQSLFETALELAFPEPNEAILALIDQLIKYHAWLSEHELNLREMTMVERQGAIWRKRQELFGSDADLIWADEIAAMEERQQAMQEALDRLNQAHEITLEETAYQLELAVEEVFGEGMERRLISPDALGNTLFSLDSVQDQLRALPAEERQQRINELRRTLGYPEQAVERMAERDKERNERWENGLAYMEKREQLTRQYSGEHLEEQLDELRREHFDHAAETIRREEENDFYRFERTRRFGLN